MIEKRLERVATEKKGNKIEVCLDGRHSTRKTILVDKIRTDEGVTKSKEDGYVFYYNREYVYSYKSLNAETKKQGRKVILLLSPNDLAPNDEG